MTSFALRCAVCGRVYRTGIPLAEISAASASATKAGWATEDKVLCPQHKGATEMKVSATSKQAQDAAQAAVEDGLPADMVRATETPAQEKKRKASAAKHSARIQAETKEEPAKKEAEEFAERAKALKAAKAKGRKAKAAAQAAGATKAMPLQGAAAAKAIKKAARANGVMADPNPGDFDEPVAKAPKKAAKAVKAPKARVAKAKPAKRTSEPRKGSAGPAKGSKVALIGELLRRKQGCTREDVLAATGWPAVSMPQQAEALGVNLRKDKQPGEPTRYFAA